MKINIQDLTEEMTDRFMGMMAAQEMGAGAQSFDRIEFLLGGTWYRFMPYFGPQICCRPVEGQEGPYHNNKPWKYFHWTSNETAAMIKTWAMEQEKLYSEST